MKTNKTLPNLAKLVLFFFPLAIAISATVVYTKTYFTPFGSVTYTIYNNSLEDLPGEFFVAGTSASTGGWFNLTCPPTTTACLDYYRLTLYFNGEPINFTPVYYSTTTTFNCRTPVYFAANLTSYNAVIYVAATQTQYPNDTYAQCPNRLIDFAVVSGTDCGSYFPLFYFYSLNQTLINIEALWNTSYTAYPPFLLCFYPIQEQAIFVPVSYVTLTTLYPFADIRIIVKNYNESAVNVTLNMTVSNQTLSDSYLIYIDPTTGATQAGTTLSLTLPPATTKPSETPIILRIMSLAPVNGQIDLYLYRGNTLVDKKTIGVKVIAAEGKETSAGGEINIILLTLIAGASLYFQKREDF